MTAQRLQLVSARVENVLGEYTHDLAFDAASDFAIIYGPNGVGKTRFLEVIHALFRVSGQELARLPFRRAILRFDGGWQITARSSMDSGDRLIDDDSHSSDVERTLVAFLLEEPNGESTKWDYTDAHSDEWMARNTSWRKVGPELWEDRADGELATTEELQYRMPNLDTLRPDLPDKLRQFRDQVSSYLIETQRLRAERFSPPRPSRYRVSPSSPKSASRIKEQAENMRRLVNIAQTEHSKITQQLDRTFPNRVLDGPEGPQLGDEEIRKQYSAQDNFRSRLGRVASVALEDALSLPDRPLKDWEVDLLNLYLEDARLKLAPFEELLPKIETIEQIINSRLLNKRIQVTAQDGLTVLRDYDNREIDLDSLSSGEQHEIILMFDLLFNVPDGSLVLIDEPEISLHVVWQLAFIPDVRKISKLAGFRFIVATHSPQIINDAWDRAVRLGPAEAAF